MTQTIRTHDRDRSTVYIYSHPNNNLADIDDTQTRLSYTVYIFKQAARDRLLNIEEELSFNCDNQELYAEMEAIKQNTNKQGFVYQIVAGDKIDDTGLHYNDQYHSSYAKALVECMSSLYC